MRLVVIGMLAAALAGCGGDGSKSTSDDGAAGQTAPAGKTVFEDNCASCHTLADAAATGTIGPNLDDLAPSEEHVMDKVQSGGGAMPSFAGTLTDEQIQEVAAYVSGAAGG